MQQLRLWESQPFYQRPHAEIAGLFDTVYVSFYKGLGGLAGAVLAGPGDFIAEARIWQRRHGGNLVRLYPYVLSARLGLEKHLGRMAEYHAKALELAAVLDSFPQIEVTPKSPHTNMMHIFVRGDKERLETAAVELARESGTWLFGDLNTCTVPNYFKLEISVGDATLDLTKEEIGALFRQLFERAESTL
jgi:threonine aldolase